MLVIMHQCLRLCLAALVSPLATLAIPWAAPSINPSLSTQLSSLAPRQLPLGNGTFNLLRDNIPADFEVAIDYRPHQLHVYDFWYSVITAMRDNVERDFFARSQGYFAPDFSVNILPTEAEYPHLQFAHIVWGLQRLAEDQYKNKPYKEVDSHIWVASSRGQGREMVGSVAVWRPRPGVDTKNDSNALPDDSSNAGVADEDDFSNTTASLSDVTPNQLTASDMQIKINTFEHGKKFVSTNLFITVIRAMARLAASDKLRVIQDFDYTDPDANIYISMRRNLSEEATATYQDVLRALSYMTKLMLNEKKYPEVKIYLYKDKAGPSKEYGTILVRKVEAQAGIAVD